MGGWRRVCPDVRWVMYRPRPATHTVRCPSLKPMNRAIAEHLRAERLQADVLRIAELAGAGQLLGRDVNAGEREGVEQIARACEQLAAGDVLGARDTMVALDLVQLPRLAHTQAMRVLVGAYEAAGDLESCAFILESLLDDSLFDKDTRTLSGLGVDLFSSYARLGDWDSAAATAQSVLGRLGQDGDTSREHIELVTALTDLLVERGDVAGATELCGRLLPAADACGFPPACGVAYWTAAVVAFVAGDLPAADARARRARRVLSGVLGGDDLRELDLLLVDVLARQGEGPDLLEADEILTALEQCETTVTRSDTDRGLVALRRARMHLGAGQLAQALDVAVQAVARLAADVTAQLCDACVVLGDTYRLLGMRQSAEDCYLRASELLLVIAPSNATTNVWRDLETRMARFATP